MECATSEACSSFQKPVCSLCVCVSSGMQMLIKGIRSFAPENNAAIEFYKPLTLIVGSNGAGKTVRKQMSSSSSRSRSRECAHGIPHTQHPMQQRHSSKHHALVGFKPSISLSALASAAAATCPSSICRCCNLLCCRLSSSA